ncbi:helix-turn-helix domain-containing protein [Streptomonospora nanhaiensis]|uniref:AraC-like DNA-binding protein n=1 Tax=Streptomonospora nanhaiensis TaxID=1323731 RepID=A0A853BPT1_9ACTN|nr:helix-turn-helix domain-containing protein [Streptomonospora nanhaiensis]MBX9387389.1 helix-turn-helix domain-containing protein [Streptomonospora nanhaiensis]NYI97448.1 AraC-like DNA-binding protein [Streptomonospora nanhaiensis]
MTRYRPAAAPGDLAEVLRLSWTARLGGPQRLVPDGCVDVLWIAGRRLVVCAPETSGWTFELPPDTPAVGVRFRPGRAGAVLGLDARAALNRRVGLADLLGARAERLLRDRLEAAAADPAAQVGVLEDFVRRRAERAPAADPVAGAAAALLEADPAATVGAIAAAAGVGERQVHRACVAAFGYGPAMLRRILRLQRFLRLARHPGAPADLAGLAHRAGFTDQSHLYREARAIGGAGPSELAGRRAVPAGEALGAGVAPMSDPYTTRARPGRESGRHDDHHRHRRALSRPRR